MTAFNEAVLGQLALSVSLESRAVRRAAGLAYVHDNQLSSQ